MPELDFLDPTSLLVAIGAAVAVASAMFSIAHLLTRFWKQKSSDTTLFLTGSDGVERQIQFSKDHSELTLETEATLDFYKSLLVARTLGARPDDLKAIGESFGIENMQDLLWLLEKGYDGATISKLWSPKIKITDARVKFDFSPLRMRDVDAPEG